MGKFLARRMIISLVTLAGIVLLVFVLVRLIPGDPARLRAGPYATPEQIEAVRERFGLSDPLPSQLARFVGDTVRLDLGTSLRTSRPVLEEITARLPATLELALTALVLATSAALIFGTLAALRQGSILDGIVRVLVVIGTSMPVFWLGLLLILVFFSIAELAPAPLGRLSIGAGAPLEVTGLLTIDALIAGDLDLFLDALGHLALPAFALAFVVFAPIANLVRSSVAKELESDYARAVTALGLSPTRDVFRNALLPVITTIAAVFGFLMGGNVLVESLFAWPGMGQYAWQSLLNNDLPALQGVVLVVGFFYVVLNIIVDISYSIIDPRVRLGA